MKRCFAYLIVLLVSCKNKPAEYSPVQYRDSIMAQYFSALDSLPFTDTLVYELKLLKAYSKNDTGFLNRGYAHVLQLVKNKALYQESHPCAKPVSLDKMNFKEAYRFSYASAFCDTSVNITVGIINENKIILELFLYKHIIPESKCNEAMHIKKLLDNKEWNNFISKIAYIDFWGLKEYNDRIGVDGSSLYITGYEKPVNGYEGRYKIIYRWSAESSAIGEVFKNVLELSGVNINCFHYK